MPSPRLLWEIYVPCQWNTGIPVRTRHHKEWDKVVRKIAGGLTIYKPAKGQWIDTSVDQLHAERVIPVRIACTEKQIKQIANFTLRHYKQLAVLTYAVSDKVLLIKADEQQERSITTSAELHERQRSDNGGLSKES